ncbi:MAG TPA: hypothetical protein VG672_11355 [Bryobacteraceae bacterium]|jgi:hypothetical protein|nr:hypothetical protein [Bryobacteraceae bacterium]
MNQNRWCGPARFRVLVSLCALALAGCGYVGDTLPPLLNIPARVTDLAAVQRGSHVIVQFTVPKITTEGTLIKRPPRAELHAGPFDGPFQADAWAVASQSFPEAPEVEGRQRYELPSGVWVGKDVIFGVKIIGANGRDAGWSNLVTLSVVVPPEKPAGVRAEAVATGVRVSWQAHAGSFQVFRRVGQDPDWILLSTSEKPEWIDAHTEYGKHYSYAVQKVVPAGSGQAQSDLSDTAEVTPVDQFPPATPAGLTAVPSTASIELMWERGTESDLAGYRIYRSTAGGAFERIGEAQGTPTFSDTRLEAGKVYRYEVSAFDQAGNESPHSAPVQAAAP